MDTGRGVRPAMGIACGQEWNNAAHALWSKRHTGVVKDLQAAGRSGEHVDLWPGPFLLRRINRPVIETSRREGAALVRPPFAGPVGFADRSK